MHDPDGAAFGISGKAAAVAGAPFDTAIGRYRVMLSPLSG